MVTKDSALAPSQRYVVMSGVRSSPAHVRAPPPQNVTGEARVSDRLYTLTNESWTTRGAAGARRLAASLTMTIHMRKSNEGHIF